MPLPRDRRSLLLILAAALSVAVLAPGPARAEVRFAAPPGATVEARRAGPDVFAAGGIEKECGRVEFRATLLDRSHALELAPLYSDCTTKSLGGMPTKMVWWDCGYVLHSLVRAEGEGAWRARVDFACPAAHEIEWNVYESATDYDAANTLCVTTMPLQQAGGFAELSNAKGLPGEIAIHWKLSGIEYEAFGSSLFCGVTPDTAQSDASYTGQVLIGATDSSGRQRDLELRD